MLFHSREQWELYSPYIATDWAIMEQLTLAMLNKYTCTCYDWVCWAHARIQKVLSEGVQLWQRYLLLFLVVVVFKLMRDTTKSGPSSAHQRNAIKMAFGWRADGDPALNAGLVALWFSRGSGPVLLRNPIASWFSRGIRTFAPSSGSAPRMEPVSSKITGWHVHQSKTLIRLIGLACILVLNLFYRGVQFSIPKETWS